MCSYSYNPTKLCMSGVIVSRLDVTEDNVHRAFTMVTVRICAGYMAQLNLTAHICCRPEVADKEPCVVIYSYNP